VQEHQRASAPDAASQDPASFEVEAEDFGSNSDRAAALTSAPPAPPAAPSAPAAPPDPVSAPAGGPASTGPAPVSPPVGATVPATSGPAPTTLPAAVDVAPRTPEPVQAPPPVALDPSVIAEAVQGPLADPAAAATHAATILQRAEQIAAEVEARAAAAADQIRVDGEAARAAHDAGQQAQRAELTAIVGTGRATHAAAIDGAISTNDASSTADQASVGAEVDAVATAAAGDLDQARTGFSTEADALVAAPAEQVTTTVAGAQADIAAAATTAEQGGASVASGYGGSEPGQAAAAAAREVGVETAADIRAKAPSLGDEVRTQATDLAADHAETRATVEGSLTDVGAEMATRFGDLNQGATTAVAGSGAEAAAALGTLRQAGDDQLGAVEQSVGAALAEGAVGIAEGAATTTEAAASGVEQLGARAAADVRSVGAQVAAGIGGPSVDGVAAAEVAATADGALADAAAAVHDGIDVAVTDHQAAMTSAGDGQAALWSQAQPDQAVDGVHDATSTAVTDVEGARAEATRVVSADAVTSATSFGDEAVASGQEGADEAASAMERGNQDFAQTVSTATTSAVSTAVAPASTVSTQAQTAASQAEASAQEPGWLNVLKGIGRAIASIVVGLVKFVALVAVIAVLAVIAVKLGIIAAVSLAACALVAGVIMLLYGIYEAYNARRDEGSGILASLGLGLLDAIGITAIREAISGYDSHTGRELDAGERTERGILGVFGVVMTILLVVGGVRAGRAKATPEAPNAGAPKGEAPAVEPPKGETPTVEPPKGETPTVEPPKAEPPAVEPPKADPPAVEPPKVEPPAVEPPKVEPPKVEPPKVEPPAPQPKVSTIDAARPLLSENARTGLEQLEQTRSPADLARYLDRFRNPDGTFDLTKLDEGLAAKRMTPEEFEAARQKQEAQAAMLARKNITKLNKLCDEADGTNRPGASLGDGTSEAALDWEIQNGKPWKSKTGHAIKIRNSIRDITDAINELEVQRRFLTSDGLKAEIDAAIARGRARIDSMRPAQGRWGTRATDHPDVWNPDGTSKVEPGYPPPEASGN
jgi:hypothetical protein